MRIKVVKTEASGRLGVSQDVRGKEEAIGEEHRGQGTGQQVERGQEGARAVLRAGCSHKGLRV